jgi:hypothetical protein
MLVVRWTWPTKPSGEEAVREWIRSYNEYGLPKLPHGSRIYSPASLGPFHTVVWEVRFEDYAEFAAWNTTFLAAPRVREYLSASDDLIVPGGAGGEVWTVEEFS